MKVTYGAYEHAENTVGLRVTRISTYNKFRQKMGHNIRWDLIGYVQGADQSALTAAIEALEAAYSTDRKDAILLLNNGDTSAHTILTDDTFGGVKVLSGVNFMNGPWSGRPEYANRRTFSISLGAEYRTGTGQYAWKERITIRGTGGSRWVYSPQIAGPPQAQTLQTQTTFHFIQEGTLLAREDWYPPADPLYPSIEHEELREIVYESADDIVEGPTGDPQQELFRTSWRYVMEATTFAGFTALNVPDIP